MSEHNPKQDGDAFDQLEDKLIAEMEEAADGLAENAGINAPPETNALTPDEEDANEAEDAIVDTFEDAKDGYVNDGEPEAEDEEDEEEKPPAEPATDDEHLVTLKGPWGEERLDPRDPEQLKKIVEYGQKGRNYEKLVGESDQRVQRRAEELQFQQYLKLGLVRVNETGASEWTEKGHKLVQEQQAAANPRGRDNGPTGDATSDQDEEVDRLLETVLTADDSDEAKAALRQGVEKLARIVGRDAATEAVNSRFQEIEQLKAQEAATTQRANIQELVQKRFLEAVKKHDVFEGDAESVSLVRMRVKERFQAMARAEAEGDTSIPQDPEERIALALREVDGVANWVKTRETRGVTRYRDGAKARKSKGPPATGGGSAAPLRRKARSAPPAQERRDGGFDDSFQDRLVAKLRGR